MRKVQFQIGNFYHIYNRGVEKRKIFEDNNDYWRFLQGLFLFNDENAASNLLWQLEKTRGEITMKVLKEALVEKKLKRRPLVKILAFCLMPNHFHLILKEIKETGISRFMHKLGTGYTRYFNNKYKRVGGLFQGTFKAVLIEKEEQFEYLLAYVNVVNPAELIEPKLRQEGAKNLNRIIKFVEEYPWSTHQDYLGKRKSIIIDKDFLGEKYQDPYLYRESAKMVLFEERYLKEPILLLE